MAEILVFFIGTSIFTDLIALNTTSAIFEFDDDDVFVSIGNNTVQYMGQYNFSHANGKSFETTNGRWASIVDPNTAYGVIMDYSNKRVTFRANNNFATNDAYMPLYVAISGNARRVQ